MKKGLCWLRRDLRIHDHHALSMALKECDEVYIAFIFDDIILNKIKDKNDSRLSFIVESLKEIENQLITYNSSINIAYGDPIEEVPKLAAQLGITNLYYNRDYEPYAKTRDHKVEKNLSAKSIHCQSYKDHVFFEKKEILNGTGEVYKVFTPYKNKWFETFYSMDSFVPEYKCNLKKLAPLKNKKSILNFDWYKVIGFNESPPILAPGSREALKRLKQFKKIISSYQEDRDTPVKEGTSLLSPYIRMGNLSVREMICASIEKKDSGHQTWLSEIIWRDFYQMILDVYPRVEKNCFRAEYDQLEWSGSKNHFKLWCQGQTGYPIIDSAMRCLNETGLMHNRLRMVVASFLTKTLLIDWRLGEAYFAQKLLDFDLAANNGGWQWSAGTGVDAQPYFRIFNPYNQSMKFDPDGEFIKRWCPELAGFNYKTIHSPHDTDLVDQIEAQCFIGKDYPHPIVSYKDQKEKTLRMFKKVKNS